MLGIQYYRKVFTFHLSHNAEFAEFLQLDWHFDKKGENGVKDMLEENLWAINFAKKCQKMHS